MAKREKIVGNNDYVCHRWSVFKEARSGNMHTDEGIVYSYRTAIGVTFETKKGQVYFVHDDSISPTTGRHLSCVRSSIPHDAKVGVEFKSKLDNLVTDKEGYVPYQLKYYSKPSARMFYANSLVRNLYPAKTKDEWLKDQIDAVHKEWTRNTENKWKEFAQDNYRLANKLHALAQWIVYFKQLEYFCQFFKLKQPALPEKLEDIQDRYNVYQSRYIATQAKRDAARAERYKQNKLAYEQAVAERQAKIKEWNEVEFPKLQQQLPNAIEEWRCGTNTRLNWILSRRPAGSSYYFPSNALNPAELLKTDLLRVNGEVVETQRSARVSKDEAKRACVMLKDMWSKNKTYAAGTDPDYIGNRSMKIGDFRLVSVTTDMVTIGCHKFTKEEVERLALELGV